MLNQVQNSGGQQVLIQYCKMNVVFGEGYFEFLDFLFELVNVSYIEKVFICRRKYQEQVLIPRHKPF